MVSHPYERRTGEPSRKRLDFEAEAAERLARAQAAGELERASRQIDRSIIDLSGDLEAAKAERLQAEQAKRQAEVERQRAKPEKGRDYDLSR